MFDKIKKLLLPLLIGSLFVFWGYDKVQKKTAKRENIRINKIKIENAKNKLIEKLVSKYNAQLDWNKKIIKEYSLGRNYFTIDLQKAVEGTGKKPVALKLAVEDIYKEKDQVMVRFHDKNELLDITLQYVLACNDELVSKIKGVLNDDLTLLRYDPRNNFIVIASLNDVDIRKLKFSSDKASGDVYADDLAVPNYVLGECIDLSHLGDSPDY